LPCPFPTYAAFLHSEYYQQVRLPSQLPLAYGGPFGLRTLHQYKDHDGSPRFRDSSLSIMPCSQTPSESPVFSPLLKTYYCLPSIRPCRPPNQYYEAQSLHLRYGLISLCLRLACVVTFTHPRLDFRWSGCTPFLSWNFTNWKCPA